MARTVSGVERVSGFEKRPDYPLTVEPAGGKVHVKAGAVVIAKSERPYIVEEAKYPPVLYLPRQDVHIELLARTEHTTHCPFKGDASYWSIVLEDERLENAVWSYEDPFEQLSVLKDLMAFYPDKVDILWSGD